jgi:hypothetical protein
MPTTTDSVGRTVAARPIRVVDALTTTDELGRPVAVTPVRADSAGVPVAVVDGLTDDAEGTPVAALPVRIVDGSSTVNEVGTYVPVLAVNVIDGELGEGGGGGDPAVAVEWTSDGSDTTPEFEATLSNWQDMDSLATELSTDPGFPAGSESEGGAIIVEGNTVTLIGPSLAAGTYYFRVGIVRGENTYWSDPVVFEITASPPSFTHLGTAAEDTYPQTSHTMSIDLGAVGNHDIVICCAPGNGKPVPASVDIAGQALAFERRAGSDANGGAISWFRGTVTGIGGVQTLTVPWASADWDYKSTAAWELFNAGPLAFHDEGAYINNNPGGTGGFAIPGLVAGNIVLMAATMPNISATFANGSTPAPDGQRRSVDGATGLMWAGDWLITAPGTLNVQTVSGNAIRSFYGVGPA